MGNSPRTISGWVKADASGTGDQTLLFYGKREAGKGFWLGIDGGGELEASGYGIPLPRMTLMPTAQPERRQPAPHRLSTDANKLPVYMLMASQSHSG